MNKNKMHRCKTYKYKMKWKNKIQLKKILINLMILVNSFKKSLKRLLHPHNLFKIYQHKSHRCANKNHLFNRIMIIILMLNQKIKNKKIKNKKSKQAN